jgi:hypothetical protein
MVAKPTPPQQIGKFRDLAREDDDEAAFDERLKKLATAPAKTKSAAPKSKE